MARPRRREGRRREAQDRGGRARSTRRGRDDAATAANTRAFRLTLSDGTIIVLDAGTGIASLGCAGRTGFAHQTSCPPTCTCTTARGFMFVATEFRPQSRDVDFGAPRLAEASMRDRSPATSRPAVAGRDSRTALRRPGSGRDPRSKGTSARRGSATPRHPRGRRWATGHRGGYLPLYIPEHEARRSARPSTTSTRMGSQVRPRGRLLLIKDSQYTGRRVPRPRRLGPHSAERHAQSPTAHRGRALLLSTTTRMNTDDFPRTLHGAARRPMGLRWWRIGLLEIGAEGREIELAPARAR